MEPIHYQPEGDPIRHQIIAELALEEGSGLTLRVREDGKEIGEFDVEVLSPQEGFISGVSTGEKINNGYLLPASYAVAACLHEDFSDRFGNLVLYDIDNRPLD